MGKLCSFSALKENKADIVHFWKTLSDVNLSNNDFATLFPNEFLFVCNEQVSGLYTSSSCSMAICGTEFVQILKNGYALISVKEDEVGLFSPNGNLMKVFVYEKKLFSKVRAYRQEGVNYYASGYSFINKFFMAYNTIAVRCSNRCYITKVNGFNFDKLTYVGEYEDIKEMKDSASGMVYILYKNGTVKLFDKNFTAINIPTTITKITFLENGGFIGFERDGRVNIYNAKAVLVSQKPSICVSDYSRFYKLSGERYYDCYTNKPYHFDKLPLIYNDKMEVIYENGMIVRRRFVNGYNDVEETVLVANCPSEPKVVDGKYLTFSDNHRMFVIDAFMEREGTMLKALNIINNLDNNKDLSINLFLYLKSLIEYLYGDSNILKKMLKKYIMDL